MPKYLCLVVVSAIYLVLVGCGGSTPVVQNDSTTCGKQLTDLKSALDSGAMSQDEYDKARKQAVKNCDQ